MPHARASAEAWTRGSLEHVLAACVRSLPGWDRVSYGGGPPGQGFSGQSGEAGALVPLCWGPAVSTLPGRASILSSAPLDATEWRARRALDATEWRRDWRMPSCRRISCHSTPPSGTRVAHSMPPSGAVGLHPAEVASSWGCIQPRLRPAETASSPLSYRAGSPDYCVSSGLVHGTVAVAPTVRRDDRVHLVAEAAPGVATSRQQIDDLT